MSLEWKSKSFSDLVDIIGGGTPKTSIDEYWNGDIPWISIKDFNNGQKYVLDTEKTITELGLNNSSTKLLKKDDIIISARGTVGEVAMIKYEMAFNQSCYGIRVHDDLDKEFVYYLLKYNIYKLKNMVHGAVFDTITTNTFDNIIVNLPPFEYQEKISYLLSNIDNLIEVKIHENKNLEQYLFYLFNEYFMEFDFNEFSNSNNKIPSSWKLGCFNDIIDSLGSGDWGKEEKTGNYISEVYCIRGADIPDVKQGNKGKMPIRFILSKNFEKRRLNENSIVIEISGGSPTQSTGRTVFITDNFLNRFDKDIICTNFCKVINPKNEYAIFLYLYLNYLYDKDVMFAYENGTTGIKNFDIKSFIKNFLIVIPSIEDIIKFNNLVQDVFDIIMHNGLEIEQLQKLRDTLLPKLMSGEIDVSKINCDL